MVPGGIKDGTEGVIGAGKAPLYRIERAQQLMQREGVDLLVVASSESYRYFTGEARERMCLLIPQGGDATLLLPESEIHSYGGEIKALPYAALPQMLSQVNAFASRLGSKPRVAVVAETSTPLYMVEHLANALPGFEIKVARRIITALRMHKDAAEIRALRQAGKLAKEGMSHAIEQLRQGTTEAQLAAEVECYLRRQGAEVARVGVNSGERSTSPERTATGKKINKHEAVVISISVAWEGYFAEMSRVATLGSAGEELHKLHGVYLKMLDSALEALKPKAKVMEAEKQATFLAYEHGYGELYPGGFIHGIGLGVQEAPYYEAYPEDALLELDANASLAVGHALLASPLAGGVRLEETVLLRDSRIEVLTRFPREIAEV
jgi:Xaa-Pro aminopeptidase